MRTTRRKLLLALGFIGSVIAAGFSFGQQIPLSERMWDGSVIRESGQPVIPLFDGWYANEDGSRSLCFGYFNMNTEEALEIPEGERNFLSDDRFDVDLPTHFDPLPPAYRHKFCVFTVRVPADFDTDERVVWTLASKGEELSVPGHVLPAYVMDEPVSDGRGEVAPLVRLAADGEAVRGRNGIRNKDEIVTSVGRELSLPVWIEHVEDTVWVGWSKFSGPGEVRFANKEYDVELGDDPSTIGQITFSEAGDYIVLMQTIDDASDDFEFYCCHTNAYFHITVTE